MDRLVPPSTQFSQLDLDHDHDPDVDNSREEAETRAKAVVVKQTPSSALSRVPPELFYHIASCLTEGFQPKDIRLVYPDLRHGALSGLTDRYPVELLTILPTGHARYREVDAEGVLGCATCLKVIRAVASHLRILSNMPCYRPWDQKIAHLLKVLGPDALDRSWQRLLDASGPRLKLVEVWHRTSRAEDYYDAAAAIRKYTREIFLRRQLNVELAFVRDIGLTRRLLTMTPKSGTTPLRSISLLVSIANTLSATEFTREVTDGIKGTDFPDLRELEIVVTASLSNYKAGPMSMFSGLVVRRPPPEEAVSMSSLQKYIQGSKLWDELRRYCKTRRISLDIRGQVRE
ncbi:BZ3500_MvSof-1268-A1-R1_Chr1-2g01424 [Microbotryum saponariae]|uniref:BZ3500_MvSof-1268-A1-R1_Chr1-2g01424 protein n=1 Tax=Microbotryum saponariae TaxID=289078 RepID=A0A2X0KYM0_9BASI|nr:BZ3500_MvSof-1268-A1-R1_Chr1-2g01424 [Microbotryum saponariae]SCZ97396.1 BZ3501_MvSof-1269-A2-R1_Chr1-2g01023 [Microbotryum saponariae]